MGFPSRFDTNWAVQPQKMARGLKFWNEEVVGFIENKGADQLCSFSHQTAHIIEKYLKNWEQNGKKCRPGQTGLQGLVRVYTVPILSESF